MSRKSKKKDSKQESKEKRRQSYSSLDEHTRQKKKLLTRFLSMPGLQPTNWVNDRQPEYLWCLLLRTHLPRMSAITIFRRCAKLALVFQETDQKVDITHSEISKMPPDFCQEMVDLVMEEDVARESLRPLLLLDTLPAREFWHEAIDLPPSEEDWESLMLAVGLTMDHKSLETTDCCWFRMVFQSMAGKIKYPVTMKDLTKELSEYPDCEDEEYVQGTVRATELSFALPENKTEWPDLFWDECFAKTPCAKLTDVPNERSISIVGTNTQRLKSVREALRVHNFESRLTTCVDSRHDSAFGFAHYSISILKELLRIGTSSEIIGRLGLRTLAECYILLAYLLAKDEPETWELYRNYGQGQTKLAFLKFSELEDVPGHVDLESLRKLCNEDYWQEFQAIDLGHWANTNLRKMAEFAEIKEDYDRYFTWTSGYVHGHWGAVRDSCYTLCYNPLHRFHRIPLEEARNLEDVIPDACLLVDKILDLVDRAYPVFRERVTISEATL
jgi:hypothetical protein